LGAKAGYGKLAVLECPDDRFAGVLEYRSYRLRNRHSAYGASQAREMGQTAKNMKFSFGGTPKFNGKEPLKVFSWLRKFVKACDDNDVSEGMGLYLIPHFLAGDAETRFTRNLPESDVGGGRGALGTFPAAVNWLLSTYAEPHALGLAQDKFSRATLVDKEGVDAFAARLRSLAELCGNIHSEGTMKQQLIQGLQDKDGGRPPTCTSVAAAAAHVRDQRWPPHDTREGGGGRRACTSLAVAATQNCECGGGFRARSDSAAAAVQHTRVR